MDSIAGMVRNEYGYVHQITRLYQAREVYQAKWLYMGVKALDQPRVVQGRKVQAQLVGVAANGKLKVFHHSDPD